MKLFRFSYKTFVYCLALAGMTLTTACSDSDDDITTWSGDYVLTMAYAPSSGYDYDYYTAQFEDLMSGSLSAKGSRHHELGYYSFDEINNQIYVTGGLGYVSISAMKKGLNDQLTETGTPVSSFNNSLQDVVGTTDGKLLSIEMSSSSDIVKLHLLNASTLVPELSKETSAENLTTVDGLSYTGMVQSGNYVYVSYYISNPATYATAYTDKAQVAVFSYPALDFVSVIEDMRTGPIGGFGNKSGLIKDESGNVYALSHTNPANGYSQFTMAPAIIRINYNATEFDQSWILNVNDVEADVTVAHQSYLGNGKVFVEVNQSARGEQTTWSDAPLKSAVLDLNAKTINYISGMPEHAGTGRKLGSVTLRDGNYVYTAVTETSGDIYVYRIDLNDLTATKGAKLEANFIAGFFKL